MAKKKNPELLTEEGWHSLFKEFDVENDLVTSFTIFMLDALDWEQREAVLQKSLIPFWSPDRWGEFYEFLTSLSPQAWGTMVRAWDQILPKEEKIVPALLAHAFVEVFGGSDLAAVYCSKGVICLLAGTIIFFPEGCCPPKKFSSAELNFLTPLATQAYAAISGMFSALAEECRWDEWEEEDPSDGYVRPPTEEEEQSIFVVVPGDQFLQFHPDGSISLEYCDVPERRRFCLEGEENTIADPVQKAWDSVQKVIQAL